MKKVIFSVMLVVVPTFSSFSYGATLCENDEKILFSCETQNKKRIISLCSSAVLTQSSGYIQYRYGTSNKIEFSYPSTHQNPTGVFEKDFSIYARGSYDALIWFKVGQYTYSVYSNWLVGSTESMNEDSEGVYGNHAGVIVSREDRKLSDIKCNEDDVLKNDPRDFNERLPDFLKVKAAR